MKKPQGWDTSWHGGMVYPCLAQWWPGECLRLAAAPTPRWGWSLTLANTALM